MKALRLLLLAFFFTGSAFISAQTNHVSAALTEIAPLLRSKTSVPLRLPARISGLDQEPDLHANIVSADDSGYVIVLGATSDCEGQHVCSFGALIGTSRPFESIDFYSVSDRKDKQSVTLEHGIKGRYSPGFCGAYCGDNVIAWTEGRYRYVIGLKAGTRADLINAANSAIRNSILAR